MTIETLWNNSNRDERAAMLAGMGVESSRLLQAWSDLEWEKLPEVVRFALTAEFNSKHHHRSGEVSSELRASRDSGAIAAANARMKGGAK